MKSLNKPTDHYQNLGYWFLFIIVMVTAGFFKTYFITFPEPSNMLIHVHFGLMSIWILLLIVQPFLIKYKKRPLHRKLGKISYVVVPLIIITTFWLMRARYFEALVTYTEANKTAAVKMSDLQIALKATATQLLPIVYSFWLGTFFTLAMINRKRSSVHARYMLAAALTVMGPTVDRFIFVNLDTQVLFGFMSPEYLSYILIDLILLFMIYLDVRAKKSYKPLAIALAVYIVVQLFYYFARTWELSVS